LSNVVASSLGGGRLVAGVIGGIGAADGVHVHHDPLVLHHSLEVQAVGRLADEKLNCCCDNAISTR
jgi:hypothetical protein